MNNFDPDESPAPPQFARVAIVGLADPDFREIRTFVASCPFVRIVAEVQTLSELLDGPLVAGESNNSSNPNVDVVIALQSSSDQYPVADIQRLIGQLMFSRILCCYGPWCISDGRTHDLWPVAFRVPVESAIPILVAELEAFRTGLVPISPLAAAEEMLVHRIEIIEVDHDTNRIEYPRITEESHRDALVVSPDVAFRQTTCQLLTQCGFRAADEFSISRIIDRLPTRFAGIIAIDLDACDSTDLHTLVSFAKARRSINLIGLTGFPVQPRDRSTFAAVFEKTELYWQFSRL